MNLFQFFYDLMKQLKTKNETIYLISISPTGRQGKNNYFVFINLLRLNYNKLTKIRVDSFWAYRY
jgi:hypothetical protein